MKNKYLVRAWAMIEITVEAESLEEATECDLNSLDLNAIPHHIIDTDEVVEAEELL